MAGQLSSGLISTQKSNFEVREDALIKEANSSKQGVTLSVNTCKLSSIKRVSIGAKSYIPKKSLH